MGLDRRTGGLLGTSASIVAGLLIIWVLWIIYVRGVASAFEAPTVYVMACLVALGPVALAGYSAYARRAYWHMTRISPIAIVLGALAVALGHSYSYLVGGGLIVAAYVIELVVGVKLYEDLREHTRLGAALFIAGVTVFMLSLPAVIALRQAALVSIAGDAVKIIGLALILVRMSG